IRSGSTTFRSMTPAQKNGKAWLMCPCHVTRCTPVPSTMTDIWVLEKHIGTCGMMISRRLKCNKRQGMKHLTTPILMFTAALIPYPKNGQAQDQASVLSAYFLKVREGHRAVLPADEFRSNEPYAMFTSLARYLNDSVSSVRSGAYE